MKLGNKFQAGGPMPAGAPAQAPQGGEDPTAMLLQGAQQAVQGQDCEMAMQVCQMLSTGSCPSSSRRGTCLPQRRSFSETYKRLTNLTRRGISKI